MDISLLFQTILVFFNADDSTEAFGTVEAGEDKSDMLMSIVTVSYNSEATISRTIESVLNQTYKHIEYIIIDGASSDRTVEIAESYREAFEKKGYIYRIYSEKDKGIYDAMNKGVLKAEGEIVGIINSDDWYEVDAVENVAEKYWIEDFDLCFADLRMHMPSGDTFIKKARLRKYITSRDWNHPTQFVKRSVYDKHLFRLKNMSDDMEFYFRVRRAGYKITVIHETLANFQMGGVSSKIKASEIIPRIKRRYEVYRVNGYSRFYIFECVAFELIKFITSRF
ncbi:MAG: glycosyltransferase [Lachnospiraceae bacterium]|nr:glycosyltransferase [Lachnospiraceae bacterium]